VTDDSYDGPATLRVADRDYAVRIRIAGRVEPIDGRFHWAGRIAPEEPVAGLVRAGTRTGTLAVPGGEPAPARLGEVDPWGGVRVTGVGRPPWSAP